MNYSYSFHYKNNTEIIYRETETNTIIYYKHYLAVHNNNDLKVEKTSVSVINILIIICWPKYNIMKISLKK